MYKRQGIFADTAQVVADDGKVVLLGVGVFELADTFYRTFLQSVAADGIHGCLLYTSRCV